MKRSVLTEAQGVPIGLAIDGVHRQAMKLGRATLNSLVVPVPQTHTQAYAICLDQGDAYDEVRTLVELFGFTAPIRSRGEQAHDLAAEAAKRARRWVVERCHRWMNRFRRILVRWDNKPDN